MEPTGAEKTYRYWPFAASLIPSTCFVYVLPWLSVTEGGVQPARVVLYVVTMALLIVLVWIVLALLIGWGVRDLWHVPVPV